MEKRDYLMDQIEQLGQALALLFSKLYKLKSEGKVPEFIEMTNNSFKSELGLDVNELSSIPNEQFLGMLHDQKRFNNTNLERLADILLLLAEKLYNSKSDTERGINLFSKCLIVYNYLNYSDLTYSLERQSKIERIKSFVSKLDVT